MTPVLLGPLGRLAGLPFAPVLRLEERLARAAIGRDRARTTLTVGALVVGLAMVVALGSVSANARVAATAWLAEVVPGDEILTAIAPAPAGEGGIDEQLADLAGRRVAPRRSPRSTSRSAGRGSRPRRSAAPTSPPTAGSRSSRATGRRRSPRSMPAVR